MTHKVVAAGATVVFVLLLSIHIPLHHWLDGNIDINAMYNSYVLLEITLVYFQHMHTNKIRMFYYLITRRRGKEGVVGNPYYPP